jgi:O-antigen/teichoic acid export membrane protein
VGEIQEMRQPTPSARHSGERLVAHNAIVGAGTLLAGALGFGMQAFLSHRLAPADYGAAFTAISVLALITLPTSALALVVAREASREAADPRFDRRATVMWVWHRYVMLAGLGIAIVGIAGAKWLALFFNVPAAVVVPTAASVPFGLAIPVLLGQLQGRQRFTALSFLLVGQAAFRMILAVGLAARYGPVGALTGIAIGNVVMYLLALATVYPSRAVHFVARAQRRAGLRSLGVILPSTLAVAVLLSTDVLLVKHFFNTEEAGRYAAVAALGRIVFWGASGIGLVLFPKAVIHVTRGSNGSPLVMASLALCLLGGAAVWATFSLGSGFVLSMFAGGAYVAAGPYLPWYALAMTLFGGACVLVANGQARCNGDFLMVLIPVTCMEPVLIILFHHTLMQVVQVLSVSMAVLFLGLTVLYVVQERVRQRPALVLERAMA